MTKLYPYMLPINFIRAQQQNNMINCVESVECVRVRARVCVCVCVSECMYVCNIISHLDMVSIIIALVSMQCVE
jgi:hypothetical protein